MASRRSLAGAPKATPARAALAREPSHKPRVAGDIPCLLDGNVLVALVSPSHVHHAAAERWFASHGQPFATCPVTQGTLLRMLMHLGGFAAGDAMAVLRQVSGHPRHRFWADAIGYTAIAWRGVMGHRQVTDAYLAALARHHGGALATFDRGLAALHPDVARLIETG